PRSRAEATGTIARAGPHNEDDCLAMAQPDQSVAALAHRPRESRVPQHLSCIAGVAMGHVAMGHRALAKRARDTEKTAPGRGTQTFLNAIQPPLSAAKTRVLNANMKAAAMLGLGSSPP